ncbi:MAG: nitroreductase [Microbacteriaceae bacterium]|nr:nitroreductase [Microbacteriaceae bacterium]
MIPSPVSAVSDALKARRSYSRVTTDAPTHADLLPLVALAGQVADHGALRPWRLIELRGDARERLGEALAAASGHTGEDRARLAAKPLRAELLIAVVASRKESAKVAGWEQDATAAGVAHALSLLLDDAGWGVMWRTGPHTRSAPVRDVHDLSSAEELLGWLYVGGVPDDVKLPPRPSIAAEDFLSAL